MPTLLGNTLTNYTPSNAYLQAAFAVWSSNGSYGGYSIYDHNYNCIGRFMLGNNNRGGGGAVMSSTGAPSSEDNYNGRYARTNELPDTVSDCFSQGAPSAGFLGNLSHAMGSGFAGDLIRNSTEMTRRAQAFRDVGTVVNESDQVYAIFNNSAEISVGPRSATWYGFQRFSLGKGYVTVTTKNSGYNNTRYGRVSYNAKTNQLCIIESNGSYVHKPVVYNNVPRLSQYSNREFFGTTEQLAAFTQATSSNLYTYFNTAANYSTAYAASTGKPTNNGTEDNYRGVPVMCDNGKIVFAQMIPSYGFWVHRWGTTGLSEGAIVAQSNTTSFGIDSGVHFGIRFVVSSDGRYVMAYCASYYFQAGIYCALIRVSDGKTIYDFEHPNSFGYQFTPIGKSDFMCQNGDNSDSGNALRFQHIASDWLMNTTADSARANIVRTQASQIIGSNRNSTDYPCIVPLMYDTKPFNDL
jgi:hypothetical protein